jgi:ElaB/YqjD/DUF883 family membrane-anchored ribosome-binding protein
MLINNPVLDETDEEETFEYLTDVTDWREFMLPICFANEPWAQAAKDEMWKHVPPFNGPPHATTPITFSWSRLLRETEKAYEAFCAFLHLEGARSVIHAYRVVSGNADADNAPGRWWRWQNENQWIMRAYGYDSMQEYYTRLRAEEQANKQLDTAREFARATNRATARLTHFLMEKATDVINDIPGSKISIAGVLGIMKTAASLAKSSYELEEKLLPKTIAYLTAREGKAPREE